MTACSSAGVTDGTPAGTAGRLAAADPTREDLAAAVAALGGRLFFPALDPAGGGALWAVWPGDAAEEVFLLLPHAAQPGDATSFTFENSLALLGRAGDRALAWTCDRGLFAIDSQQGTPLFDEDDDIGFCENVEAVPAGQGAIVQSTAYSDARGDRSVLWATDGTCSGTFRIPVSLYANPRGPVALADRAVFLAGGGSGTGSGKATGVRRVPERKSRSRQPSAPGGTG